MPPLGTGPEGAFIDEQPLPSCKFICPEAEGLEGLRCPEPSVGSIGAASWLPPAPTVLSLSHYQLFLLPSYSILPWLPDAPPLPT